MAQDTDSPIEAQRSRRQFLKGIGGLAVLGAAAGGGGVAVWRALSDDGGSGLTQGVRGAPNLEDFADNIVSGGPGRGGIPAIDEPKFVPAAEAGFLNDKDFVFGLVRNGETKAYPQLVLVWHEITNDTIGGEPIAITYCPLTGSVVGFQGTAGKEPLTFNTTGNLVNSNLLMFDNETDSEWPQLLGQAIKGPKKRERLTEIPLVWARWGRWREAHPDTQVMSTDTGFSRSYGSDPYGSYEPPVGGYYEPNSRPLFPIMGGLDDRLPPKEVMIAIKADEARAAVRKSMVERARVFPFRVGGSRFVAIWDEELASARVFESAVGGRTLRFRRGEFRDSTTGTTWDATGSGRQGSLAGKRLPTGEFLDVMWFSWVAFHPQTELIK